MKKLACLCVLVAFGCAQNVLGQSAGWKEHLSRMETLSLEEKFPEAAKEGAVALTELEKMPATFERNSALADALIKMGNLQQQLDAESNWVWDEYVLRCLLQGKQYQWGKETRETVGLLKELSKACSMQKRAQEAQSYTARAEALEQSLKLSDQRMRAIAQQRERAMQVERRVKNSAAGSVELP